MKERMNQLADIVSFPLITTVAATAASASFVVFSKRIVLIESDDDEQSQDPLDLHREGKKSTRD